MRAVLCYHKVGTEAAEGRWINVSPETLAAHIRFFQRRGYAVVMPAEVARKGLDRAVALTFDDAFLSMLDNGVPVLQSCGVKATIYAVSEKVGASADWEGCHGEPLASWERLREAQSAGMEIGNHTATHASFKSLDYAAQVEEIKRCDSRLREEGLNPLTFCLPYGHYSAETSEAIRESGYDIGFTVEKRWVRDSDDPRLLPRFAMSFGDKVPGLLYKLFIRPMISSSKR
ncbi:MAG: polysaccharide deacetylase family protein [Armatimonadetes bacterium]|nr:polysaccharide deacetylase family protein [Armatimonadota bacterium]MBS1711164.1 polysaccharide deacetylase family protein [Armatimonadota bacterium]MBX3108838.1 polysaccharide deacetylase family protein [Fimbriimonadaceae bacterium]